MQKPIADMARYIKSVIPTNIPKTYAIKPMFNSIGSDEMIRNGIVLFRDFLFHLCDRLIADGHLYDKPLKSDNKNTHGVSLATCYPFINYIKNVLFNIGFHGKFIDNNTVLRIDDWQQISFTMGMYGEQQQTRLTIPKIVEALRFLISCGIYIGGVNIDETKPDLSKITQLEISFPDNPNMLVGLKVMATAQRKFAVKGNNDAFLRCDYRIVAEEKIEDVITLNNYIRPLPLKIQEFILKFHHDSIDKGLICNIDVFFLIVRFVYYYNKKEIWSFSMSVDSGFRILIKAQNTNRYTHIIKTFPLSLEEIIARGYGCEKKRFGLPCQKGCHGFSFSLDEETLKIGNYIEIWLDKELSCLKNYNTVRTAKE